MRRRRALGVVATVAAVTLVTMIVAAVVALGSSHGYTSRAQLYVSGSSARQSDDAAGRRVRSFATVARSRQVAARVDRSLDLPGSADDLRGRVHVTVVPDTLLIQVQVDASSAAAAQRINTALVAQTRSLVAQIDPGTNPGRSPLRVVSGPTRPTAPNGRPVLRNLLVGLPVGLALGLLVALALGLRSRPLHEQTDFEDADLPVLGELNFGRGRGGPGSDDANGVDDAELAPLCDAIRFLGVDSAGPTLVLTAPEATGPDPVETGLRIARATARAGNPTLLVDADLSVGTMASRSGSEDGLGLSDVVAGHADLSSVVQVTDNSGLAVLTRGTKPPNPADLLGSAALRRLLGTAGAEYRTVVVVAPSLDRPDEVAALTAATDGALLLVRRGEVTRRSLRRAVARASAVGGRVLGVVLDQRAVVAPALPPAASHRADVERPARTSAVGGRGPDAASTPAASTSDSEDLMPAEAAVGEAPSPGAVVSGDAAVTDDVAAAPGELPPDVPPPAEPPAVHALPARRSAAATAGDTTFDPWAIRQTPAHPDPFWVDDGPSPVEPVEPVAEDADQVPPDASRPEVEQDDGSDVEVATPAQSPRPSPWLTTEGETWTPPEPPPVDRLDPLHPLHPLDPLEPLDPLDQGVSEVRSSHGLTDTARPDNASRSEATAPVGAVGSAEVADPSRTDPLTAGRDPLGAIAGAAPGNPPEIEDWAARALDPGPTGVVAPGPPHEPAGPDDPASPTHLAQDPDETEDSVPISSLLDEFLTEDDDEPFSDPTTAGDSASDSAGSASGPSRHGVFAEARDRALTWRRRR